MPKKKSETPETPQKNLLLRLFSDERFRLAVALSVLGFGILLGIALLSYLFTWQADQAIISNDTPADNWAGTLGARLANLLAFKSFGISSFFIPVFLVVLGFRFLRVRIVSLRYILKVSALGMVLFSIILGFLFQDANGYLGSGLGGAHGFFVSQKLQSLLGASGAAILLLILLILYFAYTSTAFVAFFTNFFKSLNLHSQKKPQPENATENTETQPQPEPEIEHDFTPTENPIAEPEPETPQTPEPEIEEDSEPEQTPSPPASTNEIPFTINNTSAENENNNFSDADDDEPMSLDELFEPSDELEPYDPTKDLSLYQTPPTSLLLEHKSNSPAISALELNANKDKIVDALAKFKIDIKSITATTGPTVTLYEIVPADGIRISKIKNLEDDIAMSLAALGIRIIAPMPGKGTIGIEVPNPHPEIVSMRALLESPKFQESNYELPIALGKTISNDNFVFDLAKLPHLLVAGSTGQGKSVGLNAIIASLLYKKHPSMLKLVMIDPKSVEFTPYEKIERHFLAKVPDAEEAIITDMAKVIYTVNSLCIEMDARYSLLKNAGVRNIKEYNQKFQARLLNPEKEGHRFLPYIIVVIDEYADLVMTAGKEIEMPIARLAQKARAAGIHLIIATQRPTTNVVTGTIKANFPARIAFRVIARIDSMTILDAPGANQLIGRGDLLFTSGGDLTRVQCAFIDTPEIEAITAFIAKQQGYSSALLLPEYSPEENNISKDVDLSKLDELFDDAARLMVTHQAASTSNIQRKFSIGFNRAGRIMDQLELAKIVGPNKGSKQRDVLISDLDVLEELLKQIHEEKLQ